MKIIIFAPHPDDECYSSGGSILQWLQQGHDLHVIWFTDGRAAYREALKRNDLIICDASQISEEKLAKIRTAEANNAAEYLGINKENRHFLHFYDQELKYHINTAVERIKNIVEKTDIFVIPSAHNNHPDHQATHDIAVQAAEIYNLINIEFYVYALYNILKADKTRLLINKTGDLRYKVYNAVILHKSLFYIRSNVLETQTLKSKRKERFGVYKLQDKGKYYNF